MSRQDFTESQRDAQADYWLGRQVEDSLSVQEKAAFDIWRKNPKNAVAYIAAEALGEEIAQLKGDPELRALANESEAVAAWRRMFAFSKPVLLAASVAACAFAYFQWFAEKPVVQTYRTAIGEQRTETLADGSQIILNTNTQVRVAYSSGQRDVVLSSGEAIFEVVRQASRPFVVKAGRGEVAVLGTRFQVRHERKMVAVTLLEGSVRVVRLGSPGNKVLTPGQQALYSDEFSGISTRSVNVAGLDGWTRGRLEFQFTPLAEVVEEANRYSTHKLRVDDPYLRGMKVSGTYRAGDMPGIVQALIATYPVKADYGKDEIVLTAR